MKLAGLLLAQALLSAQSGSFSLGTASIAVGSAAGNGSVQLVASSPNAWTAVSNASWLHVAPASAGGTGSALIQFSYDTNPNAAAQTGTLTIASQTLTVSQAGSGFVPVSQLTTLISQGLNLPYGVAVDSAGNVYIADTGHNAIQQWSAATQQMTPLVASGLNSPHGVAVDGQGNVYIADAYNNAIKQWNPATQQVNTLVSSGLNFPVGVAVDAQGNVYIADFGNNAIKQWNPSTQQVTTLVATGLSNPAGVAVDGLGNVYIADFRNNAIKQWSPATQQAVTLLSGGLSFPNAVALDGQGNVYLLDGNNNALKQWSAATQSTSTLAASGVNGTFGLAMDAQGNLYIANTTAGTIQKFSAAYIGLPSASLTEPASSGSDSVSVQVLPASALLTAASNQPWLTITAISAGAINFSFQANTSVAGRSASINVMGQIVSVTQSGDTPASLTESAGNGQGASLGQAFPTALTVTAKDAAGNPVQGAMVTFTATPGATGASGTFSSSPPMPVLTNQNGDAVAPTLTANNVAGQFTVTASVNGLNTTFTLNNLGYTLEQGSLIVGSAAGAGSVLLAAYGSWTATSNASWLHVSSQSAAGSGSALIQFSYDANPNAAGNPGR